MLAVEPSTVPHTLGLATAAAHGQALTLRPGDVAEPWIVARPFVSGRPVGAVDVEARIVERPAAGDIDRPLGRI